MMKALTMLKALADWSLLQFGTKKNLCRDPSTVEYSAPTLTI